jgi:hypothetical protein
MSVLTKLKNIGFVFLFSGVFLLFLSSCSDSEFSTDGCENKADCEVKAQTFSFEIGEWSRCSLACGGGQRTRTIQCLNKDNAPVPDSECSGVKPAVTESCNPAACTSEYSWNKGPYSACSKTCGGGQTFREVTCQSKDGVFVAETNCDEAKPGTSKTCNTNACPEVYTWAIGTPGACSKTCGGGTATVSVTCQNAAQVIVDDSFCTETKPDETVVCNPQSCNYSYTWTTGSYGTCTKTCGGGTQTRSLGCIRNDGVYVPHTLCTEAQPITTRACNTQACTPTCDKKTISESVPAARNELDILLVVDDSGSMYQDNARLATKLAGFVNRLENSNIDWQMCVTSTDTDYFQGRPIQWQGGNGHVLKKNSGNLSNIFSDTMRWIGAGFSSDEQGIKAMNLSVKDNGRSNCYRQGAGLSVIVISDEDERSVGGNRNRYPDYVAQYRALGPLNTPNSFLTTMSQSFPAGKRFVVNSIIVKDAACMAQQDAQGEKSFYGTKYQELANLTNGVVESICSPDFAVSLANIHSCITRTLGTIKLTCTPDERPKLKVNGTTYDSFTITNDNEIIFNPVIPGPATITGSYCCQK